MAFYANQKTIKIPSLEKIYHDYNNKENPKSYLKGTDWEHLMNVMSVLSGNEFKIYMYILKWKGKEQYFFSPADIQIRLDIGEDTARKAFKTFTEYGFLKQISTNVFEFDPMPENFQKIATEKMGQRALKRKKLLPENYDEEIT